MVLLVDLQVLGRRLTSRKLLTLQFRLVLLEGLLLILLVGLLGGERIPAHSRINGIIIGMVTIRLRGMHKRDASVMAMALVMRLA